MTSLITPPEVATAEDVAVRPARTVVRPGILPGPGPKQWVPACALHVLVPGRGVAVLLPGGGQAALFLLPNGMIYAVDNLDPYSGAAVMSRGLTGDHAGEPTVASPLLKQVFSLRTGVAIDDPDNPDVALPTYSVRVHHGIVRIGIPVP